MFKKVVSKTTGNKLNTFKDKGWSEIQFEGNDMLIGESLLKIEF
jgi:hypothetical protein